MIGNGDGGSSMPRMSSPGSRELSTSRSVAGQREEPSIAICVWPSAPGRARRHRGSPVRRPYPTGGSPRSARWRRRCACSRWKPSSAAHPLPGSRLLHDENVVCMKYGTSGALQQVSPRGRHVAQLRGGTAEDRMRHHRVLGADQRMVGERAVGDAGLDEHPAFGGGRHVGQAEPAAGRPEQSAASTPPFIRSSRLVPPGEVFGARCRHRRRRRRRRWRRAGSRRSSSRSAPSAAASMAATMLA